MKTVNRICFSLTKSSNINPYKIGLQKQLGTRNTTKTLPHKIFEDKDPLT